MIYIKQGNILKADSEALVNTVNCVGIMGRGIALQFKKAYPENFEAYRKVCKEKKLHPGMVYTYKLSILGGPQYIVNLPTKRHWKGRSKLKDIQDGLGALAQEIKKLGIRSISIPPLGCGLGGLSWETVRPIIEGVLGTLTDVEVYIYEPLGAPEAKEMVNRTRKPGMTVGRASLVMLVKKYLEAMLDDSITLLEIHKLMYFMQEAGEKLRLNYKAASYGPYAENLRHVLILIEGHFIDGFGEGDDNPEKTISVLPEAHSLATSYLQEHPATKERLDSVAKLIEGFETPYGMELLSTVHWVATHEKPKELKRLTSFVHKWSNRKRTIMKDEHIKIAFERLKALGWYTN